MASMLNAHGVASVTTGSTARTRNLALSSGTGRKIVVLATNSSDSTATLDSATFDGTAMTSFYNRTISNSTRERWWYYDIPDAKTAASYDVTVTISADSANLVIGAWITQGDTVGAPQYATDITLNAAASAVVDVAVSSPAGGVVLFSSQRYGTTDANLTSGDVTILGAGETTGTNGRTTIGYAVTASAKTATGVFTYASTTGDKTATAVITSPGNTLAINQQPSNAWDGEPILPAIVVHLTSDGSTINTGATDTVTASLSVGSGTLGDPLDLSVAAVAGIATFPSLKVAGSGVHAIQFAATGYISAVSNSFKVATGTGVPGGGGGVIILGGQMQRAMKDAETTAARKRVFFDIRDSAGAGWAGSVSGVKAKRSLSGATEADTTNDIVRVGGALHYVELDDTEAASGAAGDVIACYVPADTGRLESTHGFYEITADDVAEASNTPGEIADAVWDEALSGHSTSGTGGKVLADAATAAGLATLSGKVDTVDDFLDTEMAAGLAAIDTEVVAIKAKTDSLTFTVAGVVDTNVQLINDVPVTGDGSSGDKFDVV